jgi:nitroreductase
MDAIDCIFTRRSIRKFEQKPVPQELVTQILHAAMMAPSAGNQRPWQFVVIDDRSLLDKIPSIHPYAAMTAESPVAILVCGDLSVERHKGFWVQDCAAATQNLLLAAHALGLGAVWTAVHPRQDRGDAFRKLLNLPEAIVPLALVPMGYPAEKARRVERFDPSRVHHNGW